VRDAVRDAGFSKPRVEGESNGEWIIVDCGAAVAHIMQPTIRQYYHLEELWGEKPIKLKLGSAAPLVKASKPEPKAEVAPVVKVAAKKVAAKTAKGRAKPAVKVLVKAPVRDHEPGYIGRLGKTSDWTAKRNEAEVLEEPSKPARASRVPTKTAAAKTPTDKSPVVKTVAAKAPAKKVAAKTPATKTTAKKTPAVKS
jgi:ribosome-associated protein